MRKFISLLFLVTILLSLNFNLAFSDKSNLNNSQNIAEQTKDSTNEFDISTSEYYEPNSEDDILFEEDDTLFQENRTQSVILFIFCLICIICYLIFMKKEKYKNSNKNSKLTNTEIIAKNNKTSNTLSLLYLISVIFVGFMIIFCFIATIIEKNLAEAFIIVMLGGLMYTLFVLTQNENNLTNIINKSINKNKKSNLNENKNDKDFTFAVVDFLTVISSVILILAFLFISLWELGDGFIVSAIIFILLAIFMVMLLRFWMLIQHNNKISINIKQNKLKNIYSKSGVHLKFDNKKIKKTIKLSIKKKKKNKQI